MKLLLKAIFLVITAVSCGKRVFVHNHLTMRGKLDLKIVLHDNGSFVYKAKLNGINKIETGNYKLVQEEMYVVLENLSYEDTLKISHSKSDTNMSYKLRGFKKKYLISKFSTPF